MGRDGREEAARRWIGMWNRYSRGMLLFFYLSLLCASSICHFYYFSTQHNASTSCCAARRTDTVTSVSYRWFDSCSCFTAFNRVSIFTTDTNIFCTAFVETILIAMLYDLFSIFKPVSGPLPHNFVAIKHH